MWLCVLHARCVMLLCNMLAAVKTSFMRHKANDGSLIVALFGNSTSCGSAEKVMWLLEACQRAQQRTVDHRVYSVLRLSVHPTEQSNPVPELKSHGGGLYAA